jgi:hypothetical protein
MARFFERRTGPLFCPETPPRGARWGRAPASRPSLRPMAVGGVRRPRSRHALMSFLQETISPVTFWERGAPPVLEA